MQEKNYTRSKAKIQILFLLGIFLGVMIAGFSALPFFFPGEFVRAASYESFDDAQPPNVNLEVPVGGQRSVAGIADYIQLIYTFAISAIGIVATIMIMWGGFKWIAAAGNSSKIGDAKDTIYNAIIGVIIALLSYTLLYIINPELVNISNTKIKAVPIKIAKLPLSQLPACSQVAAGKECEVTECGSKCLYTKSEECHGDVCSGVNQGKSCVPDPTDLKSFTCLDEYCAGAVQHCLSFNYSDPNEFQSCMCGASYKTSPACEGTNPCRVGVSCVWSYTLNVCMASGNTTALAPCDGKADGVQCGETSQCINNECITCEVREGYGCGDNPNKCCNWAGLACEGIVFETCERQ